VTVGWLRHSTLVASPDMGQLPTKWIYTTSRPWVAKAALHSTRPAGGSGDYLGTYMAIHASNT